MAVNRALGFKIKTFTSKPTQIYMKNGPPILLLSLILCLTASLHSIAQISIPGQLRTRTKIRDGFGNLVLKNSKAAAFTSMRTRLTVGYKWDRITFAAS